MFTFRRRTLWFLIYLLIPVIFLLHRVGEEEPPLAEVATVTHWSLDDIDVEQRGNLWWVALPGAQQWRLTVAQRSAPAMELGLGLADSVQQSMQGGYWLVSITNPASPETLAEALSFLATWLPDGDGRQWVLTGPVSEDMLSTIEQYDNLLQGQGQPVPQQPDSIADRLISPPIGSEEHLAFLLWVGVLQQRLGDDRAALRWDHRFAESQVVFNQSLTRELLEPVRSDEFEQVMSTYKDAAAERLRSSEQIHGALLVTAVHALSAGFMLNQPERLAVIDLDAVNQQRERSRRDYFDR